MKELHGIKGWDTHLDSWLVKMDGRHKRVGEHTPNGWKLVWSKQDILDFTGWSNANYERRKLCEKMQRLANMGVTLHELTGEGDSTSATVTIHNYAWYHLLLRGKGKRSESMEAYLDNIFNGSGYLKLDSENISATLNEFAKAYSQQFGESVSAVKNKLDRVRSSMRPYGYLLNGKASNVKQIRVKVRGSDGWLQGPRAIMLGEKLRKDYAEFYLDLHKKVPVRKTDPLPIRLQAQKLRQGMTQDFTKRLCKLHNLDLIRSHYSSAISDQGLTDYNAIITLYVMGATFAEIRSFLEERPGYWKEQEQKDKAPGKSIEEILDEVL